MIVTTVQSIITASLAASGLFIDPIIISSGTLLDCAYGDVVKNCRNEGDKNRQSNHFDLKKSVCYEIEWQVHGHQFMAYDHAEIRDANSDKLVGKDKHNGNFEWTPEEDAKVYLVFRRGTSPDDHEVEYVVKTCQ